jgi:acyl dehydratase
MTDKPENKYYQIESGFEFPAHTYKMEADMVSQYMKAVGETSDIYHDSTLVPPMAVAAYAMAATSESITFPPGSIHVSQELEFLGQVQINDTITYLARIGRKINRGGFNLVTVDLEGRNQNNQKVLAGKIGFVFNPA